MLSMPRASFLASTRRRAAVLGLAGKLTRPAALDLWPWRRLHTTPAPALADKSTQDRQSLKPRAMQNTKSGSDDDVAAHGEAAFDPSKTSPEHEKETAGKDTKENPLEVSPANQEMSKPQGDEGAGEKKAGGRGKEKRSHGKSPAKHGVGGG